MSREVARSRKHGNNFYILRPHWPHVVGVVEKCKFCVCVNWKTNGLMCCVLLWLLINKFIYWLSGKWLSERVRLFPRIHHSVFPSSILFIVKKSIVWQESKFGAALFHLPNTKYMYSQAQWWNEDISIDANHLMCFTDAFFIDQNKFHVKSLTIYVKCTVD